MNHRFSTDFAGFGPGGERARRDGRARAFLENWIELLGDCDRDDCSLFADASSDDRAAILALGAIALSWRTEGDLLPPALNAAIHALECQYDDANIERWRAAQSAIARLEQPVAERIPTRVRIYLRNAQDELARDRSLLELLVALDELDSLLLARAALARWIESQMEWRMESTSPEPEGPLPLIVAVAHWIAYQVDELEGTAEWFSARAETLSDEGRMAARLSPHASTAADRALAAACAWIVTAASTGSHLEDAEVTDHTQEQLALLAASYRFDPEAGAQSVLERIGPTLSARDSMAHPALLACRAMSLWSRPKLAAAATIPAISPSVGLAWVCPASAAVFEVSAMADGDGALISLLCFDSAGNRCREHDGKQLRWLGATSVIRDGVAQIATKDLKAAGTVADWFRSAASLTVGGAQWHFSPSSANEAHA